MYLARPFNFNVSPLSADGIDLRLDRNFSFSSSACDFLKANHFDFGRVFTDGVPYLSRAEEAERCKEFTQRMEKRIRNPDIMVTPEDVPTLEFYHQARRTIAEWMKQLKTKVSMRVLAHWNYSDHVQPGPEYVNISHANGPLNGFQRRLIHQLVREEFPTCHTFARHDGAFMQVTKLDVHREEQVTEDALMISLRRSASGTL